MEASLARAKKQWDDTQAKYEVGVSAKLDVLSAESSYIEAQTDLNKAKDATKIAKMNLCQLLGIDLDTDITLKDSFDFTKEAAPDAAKLYETGKTSDLTTYSSYCNQELVRIVSEERMGQYPSNTYQHKHCLLYTSLLQLQLNNATIKAPIAGIVSAVTVTEGQIAGQQVAAVTIVDIDKVKLAADITEANINQLAVGQEVQVNVSAASTEPFTGVIDTIAPAVDSRTLAYPVTILIHNPEHQLKAGMFAEANISTEKRNQVLAVPVSALVTGEESAVYVVQMCIRDSGSTTARILVG